MIKLYNKGQVTMFVIVALVVVAVVGLFFAFKGNLFGDNIPASLAPVYSRYSECISQEVSNGVKLMQSQGGRIDIGELSYASDFNPFSTHLNFLGFKIPYWYGLSGNNLVLENIPSKTEMENELESFLSERVNDCDFSDFYAQGFVIEKSEVESSVNIEDNVISVSVNAPLTVSLEDDTARKVVHDVSIDSKLGFLHSSAISIYNAERENLFLENYALDVLQSYAPVDGVEIQCAPKIWKTNEVVTELRQGLSTNLGTIGFSGDSSKDKYFSQDLGINEQVNIMYLPEAFPSKVEITPASQTLMIAEPVGTQEGMGIMGFCYVPYHFVYDLRFPVLIQIGDGIDNFQFPVVVSIDNNLVSNSDTGAFIEETQDIDICSFAENEVTVNTYDSYLNPVSANISYKCFDSVCSLGETSLSPSGAIFEGRIPACVNGELIANAEGYAESKITFSSNSESFAEIILEKEYPLEVEIRLGGQVVRNATAVVHFVSDEGSTSAIIPESSSVELKEGLYKIEAFVYGVSNVVIPSSRKTECFTVSRGGIAGFFGNTKEECVNVEIPETKIDYALAGGGKLEDYYILASELDDGKIVIDVSELPRPTTLEQLQYNYEVFNTLGLEVSFE
ncbi:MAG: hypothetical protein ACP5N7_05015 [Candidatus Pacearchaeota archaeon]